MLFSSMAVIALSEPAVSDVKSIQTIASSDGFIRNSFPSAGIVSPGWLKQKAASIRSRAINHADRYLIEFESSFTRKGGKMHWVFNEKDAAEIIEQIARKNHFKLHTSWFKNPDSIGVHADACVEGKQPAWLLRANYLIADTGSIFTSIPAFASLPADAHLILIASIDSILACLADLAVLLSLSATAPDDERPTKGLLLFGRKPQSGSIHVIITENNITELMAMKSHRSLLHCIHCGNCKSEEHPQGLISKIKQQTLDSSGEKLLESYSCTLDGQESARCPVQINFEKLILLNRQTCVNRKKVPALKRWFYFFWTLTVTRKYPLLFPGRWLDYCILRLFNKSEEKQLPPLLPARISFRQWWKEYAGR
jgi:hypothetical protein